METPEEREKARSLGWLTPPPWRGLSRPPTPVPVLLFHRGWALGSTPARDLRRKDGGEKAEEGGRERETEGRDSPTPWHAAIWSSASWMARSSDVGLWHWTHCAVFVGNRAMNCSSTTRSMIWSTLLSPANSHLRHASRSW